MSKQRMVGISKERKEDGKMFFGHGSQKTKQKNAVMMGAVFCCVHVFSPFFVGIRAGICTGCFYVLHTAGGYSFHYRLALTNCSPGSLNLLQPCRCSWMLFVFGGRCRGAGPWTTVVSEKSRESGSVVTVAYGEEDSPGSPMAHAGFTGRARSSASRHLMFHAHLRHPHPQRRRLATD